MLKFTFPLISETSSSLTIYSKSQMLGLNKPENYRLNVFHKISYKNNNANFAFSFSLLNFNSNWIKIKLCSFHGKNRAQHVIIIPNWWEIEKKCKRKSLNQKSWTELQKQKFIFNLKIVCNYNQLIKKKLKLNLSQH